MATIPERVTPEFIAEQRELGWPDIHPEDFCHRCGEKNMLWYADREDWQVATEAWAAETGREGICCPRCFAELYEQQTGKTIIWRISPWEGHDV